MEFHEFPHEIFQPHWSDILFYCIIIIPPIIKPAHIICWDPGECSSWTPRRQPYTWSSFRKSSTSSDSTGLACSSWISAVRPGQILLSRDCWILPASLFPSLCQESPDQVFEFESPLTLSKKMTSMLFFRRLTSTTPLAYRSAKSASPSTQPHIFILSWELLPLPLPQEFHSWDGPNKLWMNWQLTRPSKEKNLHELSCCEQKWG